MTVTLTDRQFHELANVVIKNEITLRDQAEARLASRLPALRCSCESMYSGPGCVPCLTKRGRRVLDEVKAANSPELPDCSTCGQPDPENITVQYGFDGTPTAQCRACYVAQREREMAVSA